jgi:formate dehydrogenase subunit delta
MDIDNLVHMANRIGEFFQTMPEREEAALEITQHLHKFWEPRMRRELFVHLDHTGGADLLPIVRDSLLAHRNELI